MKEMLKLYGYRDPPSYGITSEFIDLFNAWREVSSTFSQSVLRNEISNTINWYSSHKHLYNFSFLLEIKIAWHKTHLFCRLWLCLIGWLNNLNEEQTLCKFKRQIFKYHLWTTVHVECKQTFIVLRLFENSCLACYWYKQRWLEVSG